MPIFISKFGFLFRYNFIYNNMSFLHFLDTPNPVHPLRNSLELLKIKIQHFQLNDFTVRTDISQ